MSRTITALFDNRTEAEAAAERLRQSRIDASRIQVMDQSSQGYSADRYSGHEDRGIWASIKSMFLPDEDRYAYEEGVRRGGVLVTAQVDESEADHAIRILEESNSVDFDRRQEEWRAAGWSPSQADSSLRGETAGTSGFARTSGSVVDEERIPIVEEELRVGKREVTRGGARVRSYVVETPAHEQVTLREEHVSVERRPVNETLRSGEMKDSDLLRDREIEMTETAEEAIVAKEAVVREEVVVRKTAEEHVEEIDETLRRTEVEVDEGIDRGTTGARTDRRKTPDPGRDRDN